MDVIQQVLKDAQFLDEQCTSKDDGIIIVKKASYQTLQIEKKASYPPLCKESFISNTPN